MMASPWFLAHPSKLWGAGEVQPAGLSGCCSELFKLSHQRHPRIGRFRAWWEADLPLQHGEPGKGSRRQEGPVPPTLRPFLSHWEQHHGAMGGPGWSQGLSSFGHMVH